MIVINKKNSIIIRLNKKFYGAVAINESLKDFRQVCDGTMIEEKNFFVIDLKSKKKEMEGILRYEFCNYVLGLMKNKSLV